MDIKLREKYRVYNGDTDHGLKSMTQYGMGRKGNGNGKRPRPQNVPEPFKAACAAESRLRQPVPKAMHVNAATGHKRMVAL